MEIKFLSSSVLFLVLIIENISLLNAWDYRDHGSNWTDPGCSKLQRTPVNIYSNKATKIDDKTRIFFANFNVKPSKEIKGTLELIEDNNILSLKFEKLGSIIYNIYDEPFFNSKLGYSEQDFQEAECSNIVIKIPGEHTFDDIKFDAELQVNCSYKSEMSTDLRGAFVVIPIQINDDNESEFSKLLSVIIKDGTTVDDLPKEVSFNNIDIIDSFAMMDGTFYYEGRINYPPCEIKTIWFYVNRPVYFSQAVIDQLKKCMDKEKCPEGNNRIAFDLKEKLYLYPQ